PAKWRQEIRSRICWRRRCSCATRCRRRWSERPGGRQSYSAAWPLSIRRRWPVCWRRRVRWPFTRPRGRVSPPASTLTPPLPRFAWMPALVFLTSTSDVLLPQTKQASATPRRSLSGSVAAVPAPECPPLAPAARVATGPAPRRRTHLHRGKVLGGLRGADHHRRDQGDRRWQRLPSPPWTG